MIRSIVDKVASSHKIRVSEVGGQDTWQRIDLGFAVVGAEKKIVDRVTDAVIRVIDDLDLARRVDLQREQLSFGEHRQLDGAALDGWIPDFAKGELQ